MAFEIGTIDGIARALGRDVLFLGLTDEESRARDIYADVQAVTDWLDAHGFAYRLCTAFSEDVVFIEGGPACNYLDVPPIAGSVGLRTIVEKFGLVCRIGSRNPCPELLGVENKRLFVNDYFGCFETTSPGFSERSSSPR